MNRPNHRRSIRLRHYDYASNGMYFVTICTYRRRLLLADMRDNKLLLTRAGYIARREWLRCADIRSEAILDEFVVMPNHLHALVWLQESDADASRVHLPREARGPTPRSLSSLIGGFKSASTTAINAEQGTAGQPVWQRNYYERVIRNERELELAREYTVNNPLKWAIDPMNPVTHSDPTISRNCATNPFALTPGASDAAFHDTRSDR